MATTIAFSKTRVEEIKEKIEEILESENDTDMALMELEEILFPLIYLRELTRHLNIGSIIESNSVLIEEIQELEDLIIEFFETYDEKYEELIEEMKNELGNEEAFIFKKSVESWKPYKHVVEYLVSPLRYSSLKDVILPFFVIDEDNLQFEEDLVSIDTLIHDIIYFNYYDLLKEKYDNEIKEELKELEKEFEEKEEKK